MRILRGLATLAMIAGVGILCGVTYVQFLSPGEGAVAVDVPIGSPVVALDDPRPEPEQAAPLPQPKLGSDFATLEIPEIDKSWTIRQGVRPEDLKRHPGHYPGSAMPGEVGNFAIAGHRIKSLFWNVDKLGAGDKILVKWKNRTYTYKVYKRYVVSPTAIEVVNPNPGMTGPGVRKVLTITTCLKSGNQSREIIHAVLEE